MKQAKNSLTIIWDGGTMHKGDPIRALLKKHQRRLCLERLPAYAPMLNPVEQIWSWLKYGKLANFAPRNLIELHEAAVRHLHNAQQNSNRLLSFWKRCELSNARTLLF